MQLCHQIIIDCIYKYQKNIRNVLVIIVEDVLKMLNTRNVACYKTKVGEDRR